MKTISPRLLALAALLLVPLAALRAAELLASEAVEKTRDDLKHLAFSNPANVTPMPAWAVGQASRAPDLDALPGFQKPPAGSTGAADRRGSPLMQREIKGVSLLGSDAALRWARGPDGLAVELPAQKPCDCAYVLKIEQR